MHPRSARLPRRSRLLVVVALTLGACSPAGTASIPTPTVAVTSPAPTADATTVPTPASPVPTAASPAPTADASDDGPTVGQTDTEWGRIWDAVPAGFPRYPGATTADDATPDPVSSAYAIAQGDAAQIADWMQTSLELATYSTEGLSGPYEDASYVLDSVGDGDCRIQTRIAPQGGLILVTVLYGAACPA